MASDGNTQNGFGATSTVTKRPTAQNGTTTASSSSSKKMEAGIESSEKPHRSFLQRHAFVITLMVNTMADGLGYSVRGQFLYRFFQSQYEDELAKFNSSSGSACGEADDVDPNVTAITNKITQMTTRWSMYEQYVTIVPLMIASLVIGMKSDQMGRRFIFLFPFVTTMLDGIILACVIKLGWHYGYTMIGGFIWAASGGGISMAFVSYAIVSDTHGKKQEQEDQGQPDVANAHKMMEKEDLKSTSTDDQMKKSANSQDNKVNNDDDPDLDMSRENARTLKIVLLDIFRYISSSIISFATGYIIQYAGFFYTMFIVIGVKAFVFVFAFIFVTETGKQKMSTGFIAPLRTMLRSIKNPRKRLTLLLVNVGLFFCIFSIVNELQVLNTYQMSPPFCFDAVKLGWFRSENRLRGLFAVPLLLLWRRMGISEPSIAGVGLLCAMAANVLLAIVREPWVFWTIPVIAIPADLAIPMTKAITSRVIGRQALASTFAVMLAGEELFAFAGGQASGYLYQYTVGTMPTAPFCLAAVSFFLSSLLYFGETWNQRTSARDSPSDVELQVQPGEASTKM